MMKAALLLTAATVCGFVTVAGVEVYMGTVNDIPAAPDSYMGTAWEPADPQPPLLEVAPRPQVNTPPGRYYPQDINGNVPPGWKFEDGNWIWTNPDFYPEPTGDQLSLFQDWINSQ